MNLTSTEVEGTTVTVGDTVGFKSDIEQYGKITEITKRQFGAGVELTLENPNGFDGGYIGGQTVTTHPAADCWI